MYRIGCIVFLFAIVGVGVGVVGVVCCWCWCFVAAPCFAAPKNATPKISVDGQTQTEAIVETPFSISIATNSLKTIFISPVSGWNWNVSTVQPS